MKRKHILSLAILVVQTSLVLHAQVTTIPGAPSGYSPAVLNAIKNVPRSAAFVAIDSTYRTSAFTFQDIAVFSYFDNTQVSIVQGSTTLASFTLKADTVATFSGSTGVYNIYGNAPFTVLIGDAISRYVNGYFALDASGYGLSTKFNTWMMYSLSSTYDPHFVIFGYQNGTQFTIRDLVTKQIVATGQLADGQYYDFPNVSTISQKPLQVTATAPVSVLSYTDQDYYVPSSNGTFSGALFYGFSGYSGSWNNSITVTSYSANNTVTVRNLKTGALISTYTLNEGQVHADTITTDVFWKVQSTGTVTVANIPISTWTGNYAYLARCADLTGRNVGTLFYVPTPSSRLDVFSFDNNNFVRITLLGQIEDYPYPAKVVVDSATLGAGGVRTISSTPTGRYVYKIEATKNVSVVQSYSGWGADFMPLGFSLQLPDLAISTSDIGFDPPDSVYVTGDKITISATAKNQGAKGADSVLVTAYEGDPDGGGIAPTIGSKVISSIPVGGSATVTFDYIIPSNPQYRQIVIKVDPMNKIVESNESNNKAARPLKPNTDLLPPLSVNVVSPNGLLVDSLTGLLTPNPFRVEATIFNNGTISAVNARVTLSLFNGLTLYSGPVDTTVASLSANAVIRVAWFVRANKDSSGLNLFTIRVGADNVIPKDVNRAVNVPDVIPPLMPTGLAASPYAGGTFDISWNANTEKDLAGYKLFYSINDSVGYNGRGANEGDSPIILTKLTLFRISGLVPRVRYRFALKAFDYSNNESNLSLPVTAISDSASPPWNFKGGTGNNATIAVPYSINPSTGTRPLKTGDGVGVFFVRNDSLICAGYSLWQDGQNMTITAWGDDDQTTIKDGFAVNEFIRYKVWDSQLGKEFPAVVTYRTELPYSSDGLYHVDGLYWLTSLLGVPSIAHSVRLPQGWNMISSFVAPRDSTLDTMLVKIRQRMVIMKNGAGQVYWPQFSINQIGKWNPRHGYKVYMQTTDTVTIAGTELDPQQTPIALVQGWNLTGYLRNSQMRTDSALTTIADKLLIAKNGAGQVYWPQFGINQIGDMRPGQGYQMYLTQAGTLTYPVNSGPAPPSILTKQGAIAGNADIPSPVHYRSSMSNTGANAILLVESTDLKDGDEVGVWTGKKMLVGSGVVDQGKAVITIWGDNSLTENVIEGAVEGETLSLTAWSATEKKEQALSISSVTDALAGEQSGNVIHYKTDAVWIARGVREAKEIPTTFSLSQNYPNPFNPSTTIKYGLPEDVKVTLEVFNVLGQRVAVLVDEEQKAGYYEVVFRNENLATGLYFYRLMTGSIIDTKKMLVLR